VIFDQLSPAILGGTIKVWCLEPQPRHGNGAGASLFDRFVYGDLDRGRSFEEDFAEALEDLVLSMRDGRPHLRSPPGCTSPRSATRCS
jgi:hypothetical protein